MSCEPARQEYSEALGALTKICDRLGDYAIRVGEKLAEKPLLLVSGEVNSWQRFSAEARIAAERHAEALDRYLAAALNHKAPD